METGIIPDFYATIENLPEVAPGCSILVYPAATGLLTAVYHQQGNEFVALEFISNESLTDTITFFESAFPKSKLLAINDYKSVFVFSDTRTATLIPNPLYSESSAIAQLAFSNHLPPDLHLMNDELLNAGARMVYAGNHSIHAAFTQRFPETNFRHLASGVIEYLLTNYKFSNQPIVFVELQKQQMALTITNGSKLLLHNSFEVNGDEGIIYFILFSLEQLHLDNQSVKVLFAGNTEANAPLLQLAGNYITDVETAGLPRQFQYAAEINEFPEALFYHLLIQAICVS